MKPALNSVSALLMILISQNGLANSGNLFNATLSGSMLTITTNIPNHVYHSAGIKLISPGHAIANQFSVCTPLANGYCQFTVSDKSPVNMLITGPAGNLALQMCLNANGPLSCQEYELAFAPVPRFIYIGSFNDNTLTKCNVNAVTGLLSNCAATGAGFEVPDAIAFNPAGTLAFVANFNNSTISRCAINTFTGDLTGCIDTGATVLDGPEYIALTANGTNAYIANFNNNSITLCNVNPVTGTMDGCRNASNSTFNGLQSIELNRAQTIAYVPDESVVHKCQIDISGSLGTCTTTGTGFSLPVGVALTNLETIGYVPNFNNSTLSQCSVSPNGDLVNCFLTGSGLSNPASIVLNQVGNYMYILNDGNSTATLCSVNPATGAVSNCVDSGATGLNNPGGVALYY